MNTDPIHCSSCGAMLDSSGAVPVVIKSLIFPASSAPDAGKRAALKAG